jgi:spore germination cell wall hydrolase CwlJ-like protein
VIYVNFKQLTAYTMLLFITTYSMVLPVSSLFGTAPAPPAVKEPILRKATVKTDKPLKQSLTRPIHEGLPGQTTLSQAAPAPSTTAQSWNQPRRRDAGGWSGSGAQTPPAPVSQFKAAVYMPKSARKPIQTSVSDYQYRMLARIISAESKGEPLKGQVAVGAVILNRVRSKKFPDNIASNVLKRGQFEPVSNGHIWREPSFSAYKAARLALQGWDPTNGALYFFNPAKSTSRWIWSRPVIMRIGGHVFAV